ncbi:MAG: DUF1189 domain-containing protein [Chitinivibrionales bacterium]|nr:DUF1189 domain-containing protein [Chitinivibrionales bacterium]MBD3356540.1 DUF1189 domain-containing protein [Chitinivibrionales bacterium]
MLSKFFCLIHRSVVDPSLAEEVLTYRLRRVIGFVLALTLVAATAESVSHAFALANPRTGLPAVLPRLLPGMELRSGKLVAEQEMPWAANPFDVGDLLSLMTGLPYKETPPGSLLVVDTREGATIDAGSSVQVLLTAQEALLNFGNNAIIPIPYMHLAPAGTSIAFKRDVLAGFFRNRIGMLALNLLLVHFLASASSLMTTLVFLSLAAYIFTTRVHRLPYLGCLRLASFAVVPVILLKVAGAAAGVYPEWLWHVSIAGSTVVLFRAIHWRCRRYEQSGNKS